MLCLGCSDATFYIFLTLFSLLFLQLRCKACCAVAGRTYSQLNNHKMFSWTNKLILLFQTRPTIGKCVSFTIAHDYSNFSIFSRSRLVSMFLFMIVKQYFLPFAWKSSKKQHVLSTIQVCKTVSHIYYTLTRRLSAQLSYPLDREILFIDRHTDMRAWENEAQQKRGAERREVKNFKSNCCEGCGWAE